METILIFGGTGSLGNVLTQRFIDTHRVCIFSRDETKQWLMKQQYTGKNIEFMLGDIRDKQRVENAIFKFRPTTIIIASALKHIDQCEENINESIATNITGVQNVIDIAHEHSQKVNIPFLKNVVMVSTDKSCSPVNVYGMCKALAERMMIEKSKSVDAPKFVNVRYGNVLNSRGSILPLFNSIAREDNRTCFTVTDSRMTRFFMTLDDSVNLILKAIQRGESGDTFIPKMNSYSIMDIANLYSSIYDKPVKITGLRVGEKLHECLINHIESQRTIDMDDVYVIKPCYKKCRGNMKLEEYTSATDLTSAETLRKYIIS